jgi:hypothetical protein
MVRDLMNRFYWKMAAMRLELQLFKKHSELLLTPSILFSFGLAKTARAGLHQEPNKVGVAQGVRGVSNAGSDAGNISETVRARSMVASFFRAGARG